MALSESDKTDMLMEALDPTKVILRCGKHDYFGPVKGFAEKKPQLGCSDCWRVFYMHEMANTPPDKRREKLEELEEVLHNVVQLVEQGKWDVVINPHATIKIEKDAE